MKFYKTTVDFKNIDISNRIVIPLLQVASGNSEYDRASLLVRMGVMENKFENIPMFVENSLGKWINPFFISTWYSRYGFPIEMSMEILEEKGIVENASNYWYEWCDFWMETFLKGDLNRIKENFIFPYLNKCEENNI